MNKPQGWDDAQWNAITETTQKAILYDELKKESEQLKKALWELVTDLKSKHAVEENHNDCGLCYAVKRLSALVKEGKHANP